MVGEIVLPVDRAPELEITDRAWVEVDIQALGRNCQAVAEYVGPQAAIVAVVKADAYGHGALPVARTLLANPRVQALAVATLKEGIALRTGGITAPILVLGACGSELELRSLLHYHLEPTLVSYPQAEAFSNFLQGHQQRLRVHINVDTGMSRLGVPWSEAINFINHVAQAPCLEIVSVYSHLATADDLDLTTYLLQKHRFDQVINHLPKSYKFHLANSAGILADRDCHYDWVRPGLLLYGLYPASHLSSQIQVSPVMSVRARVTMVKHLLAGTGVSYGHRFITPQDMTIAVIGIGYADGVPRALSNQMQVLIRGQRACQVGTITMDQLMVDASSLPDLQVGEIATLIGTDTQTSISADDWAEATQTISWEILCGFKSRLPRVNINNY